MGLKHSYFNLTSLFSTRSVIKVIRPTLLLPYCHLVSDDSVPHVRHIYPFKNVKDFRNDLDYLLKYFTPTNVEDVISAIDQNDAFPKNAFLLTFDDGLSEIYDIVAPILMEKGVPAVFFINSDFVDNKNLFHRFKTSLIIDKMIKDGISKDKSESIVRLIDKGRIADLKEAVKKIHYPEKSKTDEIGKILEIDFAGYLQKQKPFLSSAQIKDLILQGFHFGSHSVDHPIFHELSIDEQLRQVRDSTNFLTKNFDIDYKLFSFPHEDKWVDPSFYEHLEKSDIELDLIFGTQNMKKETNVRLLHRFNIERPEYAVKDILNGMLLYEGYSRTKTGIFS